VYTLMLPSLAKSGWLPEQFLQHGLRHRPAQARAAVRPARAGQPDAFAVLEPAGQHRRYVGVSLWRAPSAREASQALLFVDVFERTASTVPVFWRGRARVADLLPLLGRFLGAARARELFEDYARRRGAAQVDQLQPDAALVQFVETQLAGAIGSASAHAVVASVVQEEALDLDDVMRILDEASQLRAYSQELEQVTHELKLANEQLKSLDRLKDDFMSSVTHELRTPLTSIRALAELMRDDPDMAGRAAPGVPRHRRGRDRAPESAGQPGAGHGQDRVRPRRMAQQRHRPARAAAAGGADHGRAVPRARRARRAGPAERVPLLRADADRLTQVLLNLLSNAAKFMPPSAGLVRLTLSHDAGGLTVEVHDNGPGVPREQRALVFEKFRQGGDALNRPQGTGLGLPISRQIVEHFGGRMWLRDDRHKARASGSRYR
jgi:signal transduction histidine kinase